MSNELRIAHEQAGLVFGVYAIVYDPSESAGAGQVVWDAANNAFVVWNVGNIFLYAIACADIGLGWWVADMPVHANMIAGHYDIVYYEIQDVGLVPGRWDRPIGIETNKVWNGAAEELVLNTSGEVDVGTDLADVKKVVDADFAIDITTTPWEIVWIERGTGVLGVGVELMRKKMLDINNTDITGSGVVVGRHLT